MTRPRDDSFQARFTRAANAYTANLPGWPALLRALLRDATDGERAAVLRHYDPRDVRACLEIMRDPEPPDPCPHRASTGECCCDYHPHADAAV